MENGQILHTEFLTAHDPTHWSSGCITNPPLDSRLRENCGFVPWVRLSISSLETPGLPSGGGVYLPSTTQKHDVGTGCSLLLSFALPFCFPALCHCPVTLCGLQCSFPHRLLGNRHYSLSACRFHWPCHPRAVSNLPSYPEVSKSLFNYGEIRE